MGKGYIARGHRPTASGRSYESIDPKSTRRHGRSISAGSPGRVDGSPSSQQLELASRPKTQCGHFGPMGPCTYSRTVVPTTAAVLGIVSPFCGSLLSCCSAEFVDAGCRCSN
jgi:hypothetical protein